MNKIPIVMASDENYIFPAAVAMVSILQNADDHTQYKFFVLVSRHSLRGCQKFIQHLECKFPQLDLQFLIVDDEMFEAAEIVLDYTTVPTYYRLAIGNLLNNYDKCIYLDCDVLVMDDLTPLFKTDITEYYLGGVRDWDQYSGRCRELNLPTLDYYINAGILLMNLQKIREDNMFSKFQRHMKQGYTYADQDILNVCCWDKIKTLPTTYNLLSTYYGTEADLGEEEDYYVNVNKKGVRAKIIHYAGRDIKPWKNLRYCGSLEWWLCAKIFSDTPDFQITKKRLEKWHNENDWSKIISKLGKQDKIIIFGYTHISKELCDALKKSGIESICCFCDNDRSKLGGSYEGIPIIHIQEALNRYGNAYIINMGRTRSHEINEQLKAMGIHEDTVWSYDYSAKRGQYYGYLDNRYYKYEIMQILWKEYGVDTLSDEERYRTLMEAIQKNSNVIEKYYLKEWLLKEK